MEFHLGNYEEFTKQELNSVHIRTRLPSCARSVAAQEYIVGWFLEFNIKAAFKVISTWVLTCDSVNSW